MERARDLAQDTFVRALRENPDNPRSWLFTVAANLARDEARTAIRRKRHLTLLKKDGWRPPFRRVSFGPRTRCSGRPGGVGNLSGE